MDEICRSQSVLLPGELVDGCSFDDFVGSTCKVICTAKENEDDSCRRTPVVNGVARLVGEEKVDIVKGPMMSEEKVGGNF